MLTRMLDNLLSNAVKFTKSKVTIRLEASSDGAVLKVADDGIGIGPDHLSKIWDHFYQVEDSRNKGLNSGIGLGYPLLRTLQTCIEQRCRSFLKMGKEVSFV